MRCSRALWLHLRLVSSSHNNNRSSFALANANLRPSTQMPARYDASPEALIGRLVRHEKARDDAIDELLISDAFGGDASRTSRSDPVARKIGALEPYRAHRPRRIFHRHNQAVSASLAGEAVVSSTCV
jgi:hypothetical protein